MKISVAFNIAFLIMVFTTTIKAQWDQNSDYGGTSRRGAVGFTIDQKVYVGTGFDGSLYNDFWEYDTNTDTWTQKADFPGAARWDAVGFSIGSKGYIGTGYTGTSFKKDFWEYDPLSDSWTQKTNFGGPVRRSAIGFSIGTKGYIGTGYGTPSGTYYKDFWEYNSENDTWTQKMDFGGTARDGAVGFSMGSNGYIGTGQDLNDNYYNDFWEYNPDNNSWTQKANFGGPARTGAIGFSINTKAYIGTGENGEFPYTEYKDFWEYNPVSDTWSQKEDFGGTERWEAVGFSNNTNGFIGTGQSTTYTKDFWEYIPVSGVFLTETKSPSEIMTYPNPARNYLEIEAPIKSVLEIINLEGQILKTLMSSESKTTLDLTQLNSGIYLLKVITENESEIIRFIKE